MQASLKGQASVCRLLLQYGAAVNQTDASNRYVYSLYNWKQESPADAGIPARRKNDEKNSSISKL